MSRTALPVLTPKVSPESTTVLSVLQQVLGKETIGERDKTDENDSEPTKAIAASQTFEFVNVIGSKTHDKSSQALIRKHVMQDVSRRKELEKILVGIEGAAGPSTELRNVGTGPRMQKFRLSSGGLQQWQRTRGAKPKVSSKESSLSTFTSSLGNSSLDSVQRVRSLDFVQDEASAGDKIMRNRTSEEVPGPFTNNSGSTQMSVNGNFPQVPKDPLATNAVETMDPFHTLPIQASQRTNVLLHQFHLRVKISSLMMSARRSWLELSIQDPALFYVALSHAAGNLSMLSKSGDPAEALMLRSQAIKIIRKRLDDLSNGIDEFTIATVAAMVSYEATNGNSLSAQTHMNGLEQMMKIRERAQQPPLPTSIRRLVTWSDINCATAASTLPRFPAFEAPESDISRALPSRLFYQNPKENWEQLLPLESVVKTLQYAIIDMRYLTYFLGIPSLGPDSGMDRLWFSDSVYWVQRRLLFIYEELKSQTTPVWTVICLAALIYVECILRSVSRNARNVKAGVTRLQICIMNTVCPPELYSQDEQTWKLYLWALFLCGTLTLDSGQREWFVARIVSIRRLVRVEMNHEDFKQMLLDIAWPTSDMSCLGKDFENELIVRLQENGGEINLGA
ncbi:hypothetical protein B7463_g2717, partial [Scytalidium lignicola]